MARRGIERAQRQLLAVRGRRRRPAEQGVERAARRRDARSAPFCLERHGRGPD